MKLPQLIALPIVLTAVLFVTPMAVLADVKAANIEAADAKNEIIEKLTSCRSKCLHPSCRRRLYTN